MKALSIRQPWADAIIHHGKDVENRDWPTRFRGPVLIHAAKAWGPDERSDMASVEEITGIKMQYDNKPLLGGVIGRAEIVDCVKQLDSPWFFGRYGFIFKNVEPLPFSPCRGMLGFFTPKRDEPKPTPRPAQGTLL